MILPNELIAQIFDNLDYHALVTCTEVCKNFRDLIVGTASLQYIIELAASGQKDGHQSPGESSQKKLEQLRRHQDSWKNLKWSREIKIPMSDGGLWELFGGVLGQSTEQGELQLYQLPSDLRGIEEKRWTLGPDFGFTVRDFAMDPCQDLLVLVENPTGNAMAGVSRRQYRIHLRSLSTGKPHPHAKNTTLSLPQTEFDIDVSHSIQIFGDFIGVHFYPMTAFENEVALWNWKTGKLQLNIFQEEIHSFSLLSNRWIMLAFTNEYGQPALYVLDFIEESPERREVMEAQTGRPFEYPLFDVDKQHIYMHDIQIRADPGPLFEANVKIPFSQDPKEFILVVTIRFEVNGDPKCLVHFIPSKHVLAAMNRLDEYMESLHSDVDFTPFNSKSCIDWGLESTRVHLVPGHREPSTVWVCYVYGTKFVLGEPTKEKKRGFSARLYDFNQLALRSDARGSTGSDASGWIETEPSCIKEGNLFEGELDTCLPYRHNLLFLEDAHEHCKVMCNEDCIVVVDQECREYRVLVF